MKKQTFAALLLTACATTAMAGPPQDLPAPNISRADLATTVVRDHLRKGEFTPSQPLLSDPAKPFAHTALRTGLAEEDVQPAHPLPVE